MALSRLIKRNSGNSKGQTRILALVVALCTALGHGAMAQDNDEDLSAAELEELEELEELIEETETKSRGIVPALTVIFKLPRKMKLRNPEAPVPPEGDVEYDRFFPIGAKEALRRGYALPRPFGITLAWVDVTSRQFFDELDVAVGVDVPPPKGTPLTPIPFVNVKTLSDTETYQLAADLWVLPFLNVFASVGEIDGTSRADVIIDLDSLPIVCRPNPLPGRPPICVGENLGGQVRLVFPIDVGPTNLTVGTTAVFSKDYWFGTGTVSRTLSIADNDTSDIRSWRGSVRFGRRWLFGEQNILAPYFGANYVYVDTEVKGTSQLRNALPGGEDLTIRYEGQLENLDELAGAIGLNIGLKNGMNFNLEYNRAGESDQFQLTFQQRF